MEKRVLISMVDYVLERSSKSIEQMTILETFKDGAKITNQIFNYAKFLSMPLTLGMFVPTDEDGNILEKSCDEYKKGCRDCACREYQKALDNVIFKDAVIIDNTPYKSTKRLMINLNHPASFRIYNKFNFRDGYEEITFLPNFSKIVSVEYMTGYGLELTQSAIIKHQI